ncbi:peptide-methionine (S)-S-oxide reductase MsrA [Rothia sp. P7181]|uniref:peptide-methionine (S)-S-oxide reductase MsrA n=1 Tax=unclassified Rothia (in: high G+C Gram-positive bacteria) TaxID=2689056 RepID=UPI003AC3845C
MQTLVLGGGCFWCLEAVLRNFRGITDCVVGYTGGELPSPTYPQVCDGNTGHIEVVKVHFDPQIIPADIILDIFMASHNPTSWDQQGADVGSQYRSALFYSTDEEYQLISQAIQRAQGFWDLPIVTVVEPLGVFWEAEDYHQNYYAKNPEQGYCSAVINPKVSKARQAFSLYLKDQ